jgi:hypothetical protein
MAKSKSTPDTRTSRTNAKKDQVSAVNPASVTDGAAVAAGTTPAEVVAKEVVAAEVVATDVKATPEPRRLEMVKTEPRKNVVVPIKLEDEIRRRAYEIFVQRGSIPGSEAEDWLTAEREVRQRYQKQHSA